MRPNSAMDDLVRTMTDLRPLSMVATQVLSLTEGQQFSAHQLASVIASDQVLTAKTLRLANSAYYGFPRRITTVRDTVVLLGFRAVRSTTLATCLLEAMPASKTIDYQPFWRFSLAVGVTAELLSRAEGTRLDEAFTAGVLHNLGLLALDQAAPRGLADAVARWRGGAPSLEQAELEVLGFTDSAFGGALVESWNFPAPLVDAVRDHLLHPDALPDPSSLTACVVRARMFVRANGLSDGIERPDVTESAEEWAAPPLSTALSRTGGMPGLLERVEAFMDSALTV